MKIAIVFHSATGHTKKMAESVLNGIQSVEKIETVFFEIHTENLIEGRFVNENILKELDEVDAIILGSPTYMGSVSAQMKAFIDAAGSRYYEQQWKDKLAAGFTISGGLGGDKSSTLMSFMTFAMQMGMIWIGLGRTAYDNDEGINRLGFYAGAAGQAGQEDVDEAPNEADRKTAEALGERVAKFVLKLN